MAVWSNAFVAFRICLQMSGVLLAGMAHLKVSISRTTQIQKKKRIRTSLPLLDSKIQLQCTSDSRRACRNTVWLTDYCNLFMYALPYLCFHIHTYLHWYLYLFIYVLTYPRVIYLSVYPSAMSYFNYAIFVGCFILFHLFFIHYYCYIGLCDELITHPEESYWQRPWVWSRNLRH